MARAQKKLTRKELRQDPLMKTVSQAQVWLDLHGRKLSIAIISVVVIALVVVIYNRMRVSANNDALLAMSQVRSILSENRREDAVKLMEQTADRFKGTQGAAEALYSLAEFNLADNKNEEALEYFDKFVRKYKNEHFLYVSALDGKATALENLGRIEEAAKTYDLVVANDHLGYVKPYALYDAGRCYALSGKPQIAKQRFQKVIDEFERSKIKPGAERELAKLELNL